MGATAYFVRPVHRMYSERDLPAVTAGNFRVCNDAAADWSGRKMADIDPRAYRAFARLKYGLIASSAAFSMAMIITGVANTAGSVASLNRLARCSGDTTIANEPRTPVGIVRM